MGGNGPPAISDATAASPSTACRPLAALDARLEAEQPPILTDDLAPVDRLLAPVANAGT